MDSKAHEKMRKCRTLLVYERPAWSPLAFKLEMIEDNKIPTAGTNGKKLWYSPDFINGIANMRHLVFIYTHEVMHCAMRHPARVGGRNPQIWNIACDISINNILVYEESMEPAEGALLDKKYLKMTPEAIYDDLMKNVKEALKNFPNPSPIFQNPDKDQKDGGGQGQKSQGQGQQKSQGGQGEKKEDKDGEKQDGSGGAGKDDPKDAKDDKDAFGNPSNGGWDKETEDDWKSAVVAAQQLGKMRGSGSVWLDREVQQVTEPRFKLESILSRIVGSTVGEDVSWKSPNRRFISRGLHLPSTVKDKKEGVVVLDVSGSVPDEDVAKFLAMTVRLAKAKGIRKLRVMQVTDEIVDDRMISEAKQYEKKRKGCGGTSFVPPFEKMRSEKRATWNTSFFLYLTDLQGIFPDKMPAFPVFWVSTTPELKAPFGVTYYWDRETDRVKHVR